MSRQISFLLLFAFVFTGQSQLLTFCDRIDRVVEYYDSSSQTTIYDTLCYVSYMGDINLNNASIKIKPKGSYLDITESVTISPANFYNYKNYKKIYIKGNISLPKNSTIASLAIKNDSGIYIARIHPENPSDTIDTLQKDKIATLNWNSDNNSRNKDYNYYNISLYKIEIGQEYNIKIRYLIPNNKSANPSYLLGLLIKSRESYQGIIEFSFETDSTERKFKLTIDDMSFQLTNGQVIQLPYHEQFRLKVSDTLSSTMHTTNFKSGNWKGQYLLFNTSIPDSVMSELSDPMEMVVLWRWNRPKSFVKSTSYDYKYLSDYGNQAISQAKALKSLFTEITSIGNKAGMIHSIQYKSPEKFPLCKKGSSAYAKLDGYLGQFTSDYFLNSGYYEYDIRPENPSDTTIGPTDSSRTEFLKSLKLVNALYSDGKGILKHLIIVSAGPVQISRNLITLEEVDSLLKNISVDCDNAVWRDVNFSLIKNSSLQNNLVNFGDFMLPEFQPNSIMLNISNDSKSYSFPLSPNQSSFSVIAKSDSAWNKNLVWNGYNSSGDLTKTVKSKANLYSGISDTGLVKLWAANLNRLSEADESNIGLKYGIVLKNTGMKIYPSYIGYDSTVTAFAEISNVYISDSHDPDPRKLSKQSFHKFSCFVQANFLRIILPDNGYIKKLRIYSLNGKLLAEINPQNHRKSIGYSIPVSSILSQKSSMVFIIRIDGDSITWNRKMIL